MLRLIRVCVASAAAAVAAVVDQRSLHCCCCCCCCSCSNTYQFNSNLTLIATNTKELTDFTAASTAAVAAACVAAAAAACPLTPTTCQRLSARAAVPRYLNESQPRIRLLFSLCIKLCLRSQSSQANSSRAFFEECKSLSPSLSLSHFMRRRIL